MLDIFRLCDACARENAYSISIAIDVKFTIAPYGLKLVDIQKKFPSKCPTCGRELKNPE